MRPQPLLLWLLAFWILLGLLAAVWPALLWAFGLNGALLFIVGLWQWVWLAGLPVPEVERQVLSSLAVGVWRSVRLQILNQANTRLRFHVFDHHPVEVEQEGLPSSFELEAKAAVQLKYRIRPQKRGDLHFGKAQILITLPSCLWGRSVYCGSEKQVQVYPDFRAVASYALFAVDNRVQQMGIRRRRQRGTGLDFHQLREYREGDALRQVDWKATSRRRQLISREYQEERDQQVVFLLDCGRRMHALDGDLSHFDHALNAVLLLTYVALRQGDSVGLLTFSGQDRWLPPVKGPAGMTTVLNHVYDLHTTMQPSDFLQAATRAMRFLPRRALLVWITNLRDEDTDEVEPALAMLHRKHLVMLASLRENIVDEVLERPIVGLADALRNCAAHQYIEDRRRAHQNLGGRGVRVLDVSARELPVHVVNRYLDIKRSGTL